MKQVVVTILTLILFAGSSLHAAVANDNAGGNSLMAYSELTERENINDGENRTGGEGVVSSNSSTFGVARNLDAIFQTNGRMTVASYSQSPFLMVTAQADYAIANNMAAVAPLGSIAETQVICGGLPPPGWITVSINGICSKVGLTSYIGRTIRRIDNLPVNTTLNVCGDTPPDGWITTAISNSYCAKVGTSSYIARTIRRIDSLPAGTVLNICGDTAPGGWITTAVSNSYCAQVANTYYTGRTIRRIHSLPVNTPANICAETPPDGW